MKRFDLRAHGTDFLPRMEEIMINDVSENEVGLFLFEIGKFEGIQASADLVKEKNWTLMNSLKFNEVDWTVVIKKAAPELKLEK